VCVCVCVCVLETMSRNVLEVAWKVGLFVEFVENHSYCYVVTTVFLA